MPTYSPAICAAWFRLSVSSSSPQDDTDNAIQNNDSVNKDFKNDN